MRAAAAIKGVPRARLHITSKWGPYVKPGGAGLAQDYSGKGCREQCEEALRVLGVDYIDMYIVRGPCMGAGVLEGAIAGMKVLPPKCPMKNCPCRI
jgi:aryl-alcohol dehydrogenase-like predicted oxidoreductase